MSAFIANSIKLLGEISINSVLWFSLYYNLKIDKTIICLYIIMITCNTSLYDKAPVLILVNYMFYKNRKNVSKNKFLDLYIYLPFLMLFVLLHKLRGPSGILSLSAETILFNFLSSQFFWPQILFVLFLSKMSLFYCQSEIILPPKLQFEVDIFFPS